MPNEIKKLNKADGKALLKLSAQIRDKDLETLKDRLLDLAAADDAKLGDVNQVFRTLSAFSKAPEVLNEELGIVKRSELPAPGGPQTLALGNDITFVDAVGLMKLDEETKLKISAALHRHDFEAVARYLRQAGVHTEGDDEQ